MPSHAPLSTADLIIGSGILTFLVAIFIFVEWNKKDDALQRAQQKAAAAKLAVRPAYRAPRYSTMPNAAPRCLAP